MPTVDFIPVPGASGRIGLTACPGQSAYRTLAQDVQGLTLLRARLLLTLVSVEEIETLGLTELRKVVVGNGMAWAHAPIPDFLPPQSGFEIVWQMIGLDVHHRLDRGETLIIHCRAGLGRSGTVVARILIERGIPALDAIALVRQHRPGAIETPGQESYLMALKALQPS